MAKIEAPNKGYNGLGAGGVVFTDGVAETDDEAALNYFRQSGYVVVEDAAGPDGEPLVTVATTTDPVDPRDVTLETVGTPLRDAAVDPEKGDFLAPIGAGTDNPHGDQVVSPEIHGSGPAGILPGIVPVDNLGKQETREAEFAEARLIDSVSADDAIASVVDVDKRGPLGLSDPGSAPVAKPSTRRKRTS